MTNYILSIDPGVSSGVALLSYTDETAPELVKAWQFRGGAEALNKWIDAHWRGNHGDNYNDEPGYAGLFSWEVGVDEFLTTEWRTEANLNWEEGDPDDDIETEVPPNLVVIAEAFNPRGSGQGFSYTRASLEPLVCEGVLLSKGLMGAYDSGLWVSPPQQYFAGGTGKSDKKKRQHRALKDLGYYVTGRMVDSPDADDVRSAIAHALSYLTRTGHKPSYNMISEWTERNQT